MNTEHKNKLGLQPDLVASKDVRSENKLSFVWNTRAQTGLRSMGGTRIFELEGQRGGKAESTGAKESWCYRT